jgi:hypothetical protein
MAFCTKFDRRGVLSMGRFDIARGPFGRCNISTAREQGWDAFSVVHAAVGLDNTFCFANVPSHHEADRRLKLCALRGNNVGAHPGARARTMARLFLTWPTKTKPFQQRDPQRLQTHRPSGSSAGGSRPISENPGRLA